MNQTHMHKGWVLPAAFGVILVGLFVVLLAVSSALRHHWPLLILSASAAAAPFLVRPLRPLPLHMPSVVASNTSAAPALRASAITLPKASAIGGQNEDAYGIDTDSGYLAVADGASSSFRAAEWSILLCETFLEQQPLGTIPSQPWITTATAMFRESDQHDTDWWSTEAAQRGAHAAFAGLAIIRQEHKLSWRATAVGDCVLVHLRTAPAGKPPIMTAFPITHSGSFPQNPALLSSAADGHPPISFIEGSALIGDIWLLMTDELGRWALRQHEAGDPAWTLLTHGTKANVASAVTKAREANAIADDDMTIVRCEVIAAD